MFFLSLSSLILFSNIFASHSLNTFKHTVIDRTIEIADTIGTPLGYIQSQWAYLSVLKDVQKNNEMLAAENARLLEWYQTANRLNSENKALRDLLNMKDEDAMTFKSGQIIADAETQYTHTILVRLGLKDQIETGSGVLNHKGLIGRVIETGENTSRILLLEDINSRIPVLIEDSEQRAILAGLNDGDPVLDHLPEGHAVTAGQRVVTSGHGGIFPYGVPVGETYKTANGQIAVKPYADPSQSSYVQVVNYGVPAGSAHRAVASGATGILR